MNIKIRTAEIIDVESVVKVHIQAWQESYNGIVEQDFLDNISYNKGIVMRSKIISNDDPRYISLVAESNDNIIGFCDVGPVRDLSLGNSKGEIYAIYVLDEYKKLGVGYKLLQEAQRHLAEYALLPYIAWVLADNKQACNFYERNNGRVIKNKKEAIGKKYYEELAYFFA